MPDDQLRKGAVMAGRGPRLVIGGALAAVMVFTGCAQAPGNYATVDGENITIREITSFTDQVNEEVGPDTFATNDIGNVAILRLVAENVADAEGIELLPAELDGYVYDQGGGQLMAAGDSSRDYALDVAFVSLVEQEVGAESFAAALSDAEVYLNPRFGSWDAGSLITIRSGSLGKVAPAVSGG